MKRDWIIYASMGKKILIAVCLIFSMISVCYAEELKVARNDIVENKNKETVLQNISDRDEQKMLNNMEQNFKDLKIDNENNISMIFWGSPKNEAVENFVNYFKSKLKDKFSLWLSRSGRYLPIINKIFEEHGIANELVFLPLIESGFSPYATSKAQAVGIWQFIKGTAIRYGLRVDNFVDERRDPVKSAEAAAKYLKDLYDMFGSWDLALAAYNAGEGKIMKIMNLKGTNDFWEVISHRKIKRETKEYVPRFVAATIIAKEPQEHGFDNLQYLPPLDYEEVILPPKTTLESVAKIIDMDLEQLKEYNPSIKHGVLPPDTPYPIKIPRDKADLLRENLDLIKQADLKTIKKIMAMKEKKKKKYVRKQKKKEYRRIANAKTISNPL